MSDKLPVIPLVITSLERYEHVFYVEAVQVTASNDLSLPTTITWVVNQTKAQEFSVGQKVEIIINPIKE